MLEDRQIVVFEGKCRRFRLLVNVQGPTALHCANDLQQADALKKSINRVGWCPAR